MQNRGTCCLKKCFNTERSKGIFVRENLIKKVLLMKMRSTMNVPQCITKGVLAIICSNPVSQCKGDQKKTAAISQMFNHVQLHVHWIHLLILGYADIPAYI